MRIGFDGKRAVQNFTGLGNYSRYIVDILCQFYPENKYVLYAPKKRENKRLNKLTKQYRQLQLSYPTTSFWKKLSSLWRVLGITRQLEKERIDIFHGLSNELPLNIHKSKVKSIVTYDGELDYAFPPQSVTLTLEDEIDVSRGEMLVHPDNLPIIDRNFEAMMVWMDEEPMDINKSFFIKQTTNLSRTRIDAIKYKVDVNTMEHLSVDNGQLTADSLPLQLNQIARVVLTTAKELFFDPYKKNKSCGSFILIDPITNNTSAVGMIIDRVEVKDMSNTDDIPVLDLPKLGIAPEHYEAVEKAAKELERQGFAVKIIK